MEQKKCERCGASFKCDVNNINKCFCSKIELSEKAKETIVKYFKESLCESCLHFFQEK